MMGFHRVDPLVALAGGSERMPKVFLKCRVAPLNDGFHAEQLPIGLGPGRGWRVWRSPTLSPQRRRVHTAFSTYKGDCYGCPVRPPQWQRTYHCSASDLPLRV